MLALALILTPAPVVVQSPPNATGTHFMLKAALHVPAVVQVAFHEVSGAAAVSDLTPVTGSGEHVWGGGGGEATGGGMKPGVVTEMGAEQAGS